MLHPDGPDCENVFRSIKVTPALRLFALKIERRWSAKKDPAGPAPMTPTDAPSGRVLSDDSI
jgi:hypothetical protein